MLPANIASPTPIAVLKAPTEVHDDDDTLQNCTKDLSDKVIKIPAPDADDEYPEARACADEIVTLLTLDCNNASI